MQLLTIRLGNPLTSESHSMSKRRQAVDSTARNKPKHALKQRKQAPRLYETLATSRKASLILHSNAAHRIANTQAKCNSGHAGSSLHSPSFSTFYIFIAEHKSKQSHTSCTGSVGVWCLNHLAVAFFGSRLRECLRLAARRDSARAVLDNALPRLKVCLDASLEMLELGEARCHLLVPWHNHKVEKANLALGQGHFVRSLHKGQRRQALLLLLLHLEY